METSQMIGPFFILMSVWLVLSVLFVVSMRSVGATVVAVASILLGLVGLGVGLWLGNRISPCYECVGPSGGAFAGAIIGLFTGSLVGGVAAWALRRPSGPRTRGEVSAH